MKAFYRWWRKVHASRLAQKYQLADRFERLADFRGQEIINFPRGSDATTRVTSIKGNERKASQSKGIVLSLSLSLSLSFFSFFSFLPFVGNIISRTTISLSSVSIRIDMRFRLFPRVRFAFPLIISHVQYWNLDQRNLLVRSDTPIL